MKGIQTLEGYTNTKVVQTSKEAKGLSHKKVNHHHNQEVATRELTVFSVSEVFSKFETGNYQVLKKAQHVS